MDWDEAYQCGYIEGIKDGIATGLANERERHELQTWTEMPDISDYYWFRGERAGEWPNEWYEVIDIVYVDGYGRTYIVETDEYEDCRVELRGTFYGPIPNPFEEEA